MSPNRLSPMAMALVWVSRITTVGFEMVLPGLAGHWLDRQFGTGYLAVLGFVLGMIGGMWHLIRMTSPSSRPDRPGQDDSPS
jgi:hypothetical protein